MRLFAAAWSRGIGARRCKGVTTRPSGRLAAAHSSVMPAAAGERSAIACCARLSYIRLQLSSGRKPNEPAHAIQFSYRHDPPKSRRISEGTVRPGASGARSRRGPPRSGSLRMEPAGAWCAPWHGPKRPDLPRRGTRGNAPALSGRLMSTEAGRSAARSRVAA